MFPHTGSGVWLTLLFTGRSSESMSCLCQKQSLRHGGMTEAHCARRTRPNGFVRVNRVGRQTFLASQSVLSSRIFAVVAGPAGGAIHPLPSAIHRRYCAPPVGKTGRAATRFGSRRLNFAVAA